VNVQNAMPRPLPTPYCACSPRLVNFVTSHKAVFKRIVTWKRADASALAFVKGSDRRLPSIIQSAQERHEQPKRSKPSLQSLGGKVNRGSGVHTKGVSLARHAALSAQSVKDGRPVNPPPLSLEKTGRRPEDLGRSGCGKARTTTSQESHDRHLRRLRLGALTGDADAALWRSQGCCPLLLASRTMDRSSTAETNACTSSSVLSQLRSVSGFARYTLAMLKPRRTALEACEPTRRAPMQCRRGRAGARDGFCFIAVSAFSDP